MPKLASIKSVEALRPPLLRVTFDDGLSGEYTLGPAPSAGPIADILGDETAFRAVKVASDGRSFGWRLGEPGREVDFCPDAARIRIETRIVEELAARYAERRSAAK